MANQDPPASLSAINVEIERMVARLRDLRCEDDREPERIAALSALEKMQKDLKELCLPKDAGVPTFECPRRP